MVKKTLLLFGFLSITFALASVSPSLAQSITESIVPDETLSTRSRIDNNGIITQGTTRGRDGTNLFHSFVKFNIPLNGVADFQPNPRIKTIFTRVTGADPSLILGTLKVTGGANLFFMNPRGIVFGSGSAIDTQGAFIATTANQIHFPDGTQFSSINPQDAPLLTIDTPTPIGLEFVGGSPGAIINAGTLSTKGIDSNISLVGGTIVNTGSIFTLDLLEETFEGEGDINLITVNPGLNSQVEVSNSGIHNRTSSPVTQTEVSGLPLHELVEKAEASEVNTRLSTDSQNRVVITDLNVPIQPGDIFIDTSALAAGNRGSISFNSSRSIDINNTQINSILNANTNSKINLEAKDNITVTASTISTSFSSLNDIDLKAGNTLTLKDRTEVFTDNQGAQSGQIALAANEILLDNASHLYSGSNTSDGTIPGNINLAAPKIDLTNESQINTISGATVNAGSIILKVDNLNLDGKSRIAPATSLSIQPTGNDVNVFDNKISLKNGSLLVIELFQPRLNEGNIEIKTGTFNIDRGSLVISRQGGNVTVDAKESLTINGYSGEDRSRLGVENVSLPENVKPGSLKVTTNKLIIQDLGQISTDSSSNNIAAIPEAGNINIEANSIDLNAGEVTANALGKGDSGAINISARDSINLVNSKISSTIVPNSNSPGNSGTIEIETPNLTLDDRSEISTKVNEGSIANTTSNINLKVTNLDLLNNSTITASTLGAGRGGDIGISAINIDLNNSEITANTSGTGDAGKITIKGSDRVNVHNGSSISTTVNSNAVGRGGDIGISAINIDLNNSEITASTSGTGDAGKITIKGSDRVNVHNGSSISTTVEAKALGQGGTIDVSASRVDLDNSKITATTSGMGDAGNIVITASDRANIHNSSSISTTVNPGAVGRGGAIDVSGSDVALNNSKITATTSGTGRGGAIAISAKTLTLSASGGIETNTEATEETTRGNTDNINLDAGNINLAVTDKIVLDGEGSGLFANTGENSIGNGGSIFIDPATFLIQNDAGIFVNSNGRGQAGNIEVFAGNITLNTGRILAESSSTDGGNITLNVRDVLLLQQRSLISANAGTTQAGGNGGNVNINSGFIITNPLENNDIVANAFSGNGGNININTNGLLGFQIQDTLKSFSGNTFVSNPTLGLSEIAASSRFGLAGNIRITTLAIDPTRSLEKLPEDTQNVQLSQGCSYTNTEDTVEFFNLGKSGSFSSPDVPLNEDNDLDWVSWENANLYSVEPNSSIAQQAVLPAIGATIKLPCE